MKTMLVTGATGKVGSHFVLRQLQREHTVRLLARRAEQAEAFQRRWHPAKRLLKSALWATFAPKFEPGQTSSCWLMMGANA